MAKRIKRCFLKNPMFWQQCLIPNCRNALAFFTVIFAVISVWFDPPQATSWAAFWSNLTCFQWCTMFLGIFTIVLQVVIFVLDRTSLYRFELTKKREQLSSATLKALQAVDETKTREILRITYGRVPDWQPRDYVKNVLTYDVHEQIRTILYALRDLILETTEGLNKEQVNVDFVYCYPNEDGYNGELPIPSMWQHQKKRCILSHADDSDEDRTRLWRLITSGSHSLSGSIQGYLASGNTFYRYVDVSGYSFFNDKDTIPTGNYQYSAKDSVWRARCGTVGSIIGLVIELKNDEPESTFVKGILTINTFGKPLFDEKNEEIKLKDFDEIFFEKVILSFKQLILGELAQMFIRHSIKDGEMCPLTGKMKRTPRNGSTKRTGMVGGSKNQYSADCLLTGKPCEFSDQVCPHRKEQNSEQL